MNELFDQNPVELPSALIDNEIAQLKRQMVQQFGGGQDIDLDMLPNEMFQDKAERRAALGVIVSEIVKVEGLAPDEEQVRERVDEIASTYEQPKEVVDYYQQTFENGERRKAYATLHGINFAAGARRTGD